ncbi:unnamed protein product [Schistosoma intercalatum]|nr:unnamed protein product [Schistosoma intercalatum]
MGEDNLKVALQQFLTSYRITLSPNCQDEKSPTETMFGRLIRTFFGILNPEERMRGLQKNKEGNCSSTREFKADNSVCACDIQPDDPPPQSEMRKNWLKPEVRRSSRERKQTKFLQINPKLKSYDQNYIV